MQSDMILLSSICPITCGLTLKGEPRDLLVMSEIGKNKLLMPRWEGRSFWSPRTWQMLVWTTWTKRVLWKARGRVGSVRHRGCREAGPEGKGMLRLCLGNGGWLKGFLFSFSSFGVLKLVSPAVLGPLGLKSFRPLEKKLWNTTIMHERRERKSWRRLASGKELPGWSKEFGKPDVS